SAEHDDTPHTSLASQPDFVVAARAPDRGLETVGARATQEPLFLQTPAHLIVPHSAVNTNMDNTAGPRVLPLPQARGHDDIPEIKSYDALVAFAKGAEIRLLAGEEEVKSAPRANAVQVQDPLGEAVALDQDLGATRPTPTAATRRSNGQRKARGGASSGVRGTGGAGPSSDPARNRKRGGAPSSAAAQRSD
ncbi:hypothetical protein VaNZ11_014992, partial [Volvox africanus]